MKVLHVLGTRGMGWSGGISATLASLAESGLGRWVSFRQATLEEAVAAARDWRPDLFLWHGACSWRALPTLLRLRRHCRGVGVEHHYSEAFTQHCVPHRRRFLTLLRLSYGLMERVVAVSEGQARWIHTAGLARSERLRVIPSSRRLEEFLAVPAIASDAAPLRLLAYGRFTPQKGFDTLIQAVAALPAGLVELRLGGEGPEAEHLRALAAGRSEICFAGRLDHVPEELQRADAVVVPSRWEPWGNVCLEARAAARPVIVTDVDGLPEQVAGCGLIVPPDDAATLSQAIAKLAGLPQAERAQLGQAGRTSAAGAWTQYLANWEALLREFT
jgi:glycosyltransferase involved in cell wall biosynthesis